MTNPAVNKQSEKVAKANIQLAIRGRMFYIINMRQTPIRNVNINVRISS